MPTVLRIGPYRFFFFASDGAEPHHIHVERENKVAKFWLNPLRLESNIGFSRMEIGRLHKLVAEYQTQLTEAWDAFFTP